MTNISLNLLDKDDLPRTCVVYFSDKSPQVLGSRSSIFRRRRVLRADKEGAARYPCSRLLDKRKIIRNPQLIPLHADSEMRRGREVLSFPGALKSPVVIEMLASLLSLSFHGFGIPREMFGIFYSLWL
jgi:hypothetical protein